MQFLTAIQKGTADEKLDRQRSGPEVRIHSNDSFDLYVLARGEGAGGDNARAEGFFGLLKCEFFHGGDRSGCGLAEFMAELDGWMRRFRKGRISQTLGWLMPDEHGLALGYAV